MVAIAKYLNQTVSLQRKGAPDFYGDVVLSEPVNIKARYEPADGLVRTATGDEINAKGTILTQAEVAVGDLIEGAEVKGLEALVSKSGTTLAYRVLL